MHDEDVLHPNQTLQQKLQHIFQLRRESAGRVNFEDNSFYVELLKRLGNPHLSLPPVIHVAGTNGKGSTIAMLRSILEAEGYRVHAYTSPHLLTFNERIYLGSSRGQMDARGANISDDNLNTLLDEIFTKNGDNPVTFFEFTTALAFLAFARCPADVVLLETGMGGRLDCTNIIAAPVATVITPVSYDHMEFLGDNLPKIAGEKAGIIKAGVPCILGIQSPEAMPVFREQASALNAPLLCADLDFKSEITSDDQMRLISAHPLVRSACYPLPNLIGAHQVQNAGAVLACLQIIAPILPVSDASCAMGLQHIHWPGRMERITRGAYAALLPQGWELWFDAAHNVAGAQTIAAILDHWQHDPNPTQPVHILLGMKENKDMNGVIQVLNPYAASLTQFSIGDDLTDMITTLTKSPTPAKILICGSLYNYF